MDLSPYLEHWRRIEADDARRGRERAAAARARLPAVVALLVARGATRVVLFGSLREGALREHSDVDLAVAGLSEARFFDTLWRAEELLGVTLDLVPLEDASPSLQARVAAEGEVLHG